MVWTGEDQTPQARTALCLSAVTGSAPLLALLHGNGHSGPPGSRAISLSFQAPAACTWDADGATHVPSQQTTAEFRTLRSVGDKFHPSEDRSSAINVTAAPTPKDS